MILFTYIIKLSFHFLFPHVQTKTWSCYHKKSLIKWPHCFPLFLHLVTVCNKRATTTTTTKKQSNIYWDDHKIILHLVIQRTINLFKFTYLSLLFIWNVHLTWVNYVLVLDKLTKLLLIVRSILSLLNFILYIIFLLINF